MRNGSGKKGIKTTVFGMGRWLHYPLLIAMALAMCFINLGQPSLWDVDEGRNATAALEMHSAGEWVVPTFNAQLRVDKPALLYWLQIFAYRTLGIDEFSARLPSALAALLTILAAYELARSMFDPATGLLAGACLATCPMLVAAGRFANPDALLNLCTVLTLTLFWLGQQRPSALWFMSMGAAAGLGVLAKGPVGVVLPGTIVLLFLLWERRLKILLNPRLAWGLLALLAVALPWYIWVAAETKAGFLQGFLMKHNVGRFLNPMENHAGFPGFYVLILVMGVLPWSIVLLPTLWYAVRSLRLPTAANAAVPTHSADLESSPAAAALDARGRYRFLLLWVVVYFAFFSVAATKLPNYVLPAVAPLAILTARFLRRWQLGAVNPARWLMPLAMLGLLTLGIGLAAGLWIAGGEWPLPLLRGRFFPGLQDWAWLGLIPCAAALLAWWWLRQGRRGHVVGLLTCAALALVGGLAGWVSGAFENFKAPRALATLAQVKAPQRDLRIGGLRVDHLPSLNFYVGRDVRHLAQPAEADGFLRQPLPTFLFVAGPTWDALSPALKVPHRVVGRQRDLYHHVDIVVVTNQLD